MASLVLKVDYLLFGITLFLWVFFFFLVFFLSLSGLPHECLNYKRTYDNLGLR